MFRDLKEYQEIYNLYQNKVYLSEEQREFAKAINEAGLTDEELYYFSENTDEVINYLIETEVLDEGKAKAIKSVFKLGGLVKGIGKTKLPKTGYNLSNIGGFKGFKGQPLKGISSKLTNPFKDLKTPKIKGKKDISKTVKGAKDGIKKKLSDAGVKTPVKTALTAGGVGALIGGAIQTGKNKAQVQATQAELAAIKRELEKIKKEKDDAIDKKVDKYVADRKVPINKDLTIDKSKEKETEVKPETKTETKPTNPSGKVIPKPTKPLSDKSPAAKAGIPKERRQKFANQNAAFQATKRKDSGYTKMDFIKDFPNSQTAKKYRKGEPIPGFKYKKNLKSSYEYDAYDLVLEYLLSTEQVATIEEANYVMTEMDGKTINDIVKEVTQSLEEGIGSVRILPALGKMALGAAAVKGISSYLGKKSGESSIKGGQKVKDKAGTGGDLIKQGVDVIKKAKENPGTGLNPNTRKALDIMKQEGY